MRPIHPELLFDEQCPSRRMDHYYIDQATKLLIAYRIDPGRACNERVRLHAEIEWKRLWEERDRIERDAIEFLSDEPLQRAIKAFAGPEYNQVVKWWLLDRRALKILARSGGKENADAYQERTLSNMEKIYQLARAQTLLEQRQEVETIQILEKLGLSPEEIEVVVRNIKDKVGHYFTRLEEESEEEMIFVKPNQRGGRS